MWSQAASLGRQGLNALLDAASRREFDLVVFVRLDRITPLGASHAHAFFDRLDAYGVAYKSLSDPWLDSNIPMVRDILVSIMATFAKNERETLIARTKAGLTRARAEGKVLGRPRVLGSKGHVGDLQRSRSFAMQVRASVRLRRVWGSQRAPYSGHWARFRRGCRQLWCSLAAWKRVPTSATSQTRFPRNHCPLR